MRNFFLRIIKSIKRRGVYFIFRVIRSLKFCTIKTHQQSLEMKIYRTASKSMIKTNGVQKVFFCLRIDSKYMNIVIDQRGKECLEVREKLAYANSLSLLAIRFLDHKSFRLWCKMPYYCIVYGIFSLINSNCNCHSIFNYFWLQLYLQLITINQKLRAYILIKLLSYNLRSYY